LINNFINIGGP